jgi:ABC-2 type transport system permease protein
MSDVTPPPPPDEDRDEARHMGHWHDIRLVAGRELQTRLRSKALVISTGITLALILAGAILPALLRDDGPETFQLGLVGEGAELAEPLRELDRADADIRFELETIDGRDEADQLVEDGKLDVAVVDSTVIVRRSVPQRLGPLLDAAARSNRIRTAIEAGDVEESVVSSLTDPEPLKVEPQRTSDSAAERRSGLVRVGSFLLYGQILGFSVFVAGGVVEEKASRVVEVLLARLLPTDLLAGKIIGLGLLGLGQLVLFVVVGMTAASLAGTVDLPPGWPGAVLEIFAWFLLGYTFYSCAYAVAGSLVSRQEELQNTSAPLTVLLVVSFVLSLGVSDDPNGPVAVIGSLLPFSAPLVMPLRSAAGDVPLWQTVLAILFAGASAVGMVVVAGRIYTGGALRFGGRVKLLDAWRGSSAGSPSRAGGPEEEEPVQPYRVDGTPPRVATGQHPIVPFFPLDPHPSGPHPVHGSHVVPPPVERHSTQPNPVVAAGPPPGPRPHPAEGHQAQPYRFDTYPAQSERFGPPVAQPTWVDPRQPHQPAPDPSWYSHDPGAPAPFAPPAGPPAGSDPSPAQPPPAHQQDPSRAAGPRPAAQPPNGAEPHPASPPRGNPFGPLAGAHRAEPSTPAWGPPPSHQDQGLPQRVRPNGSGNGRRPTSASVPAPGAPEDADADWQDLTLPDLTLPELTQVHPPAPRGPAARRDFRDGAPPNAPEGSAGGDGDAGAVAGESGDPNQLAMEMMRGRGEDPDVGEGPRPEG